MNLKQLFVAVPAALFIIGNGVAIAGQTVDVAGTIACVTDSGTRRSLTKDTSSSTLRCDASSSPTMPPFRSSFKTA